MTIKEAMSTRLLLQQINPFSELLLDDGQKKAVQLLRKSVEKKMKKYPKYFKTC